MRRRYPLFNITLFLMWSHIVQMYVRIVSLVSRAYVSIVWIVYNCLARDLQDAMINVPSDCHSNLGRFAHRCKISLHETCLLLDETANTPVARESVEPGPDSPQKFLLKAGSRVRGVMRLVFGSTFNTSPVHVRLAGISQGDRLSTPLAPAFEMTSDDDGVSKAPWSSLNVDTSGIASELA